MTVKGALKVKPMTADLDEVRGTLDSLLESGRKTEVLDLIVRLLGDLRARNTQLELRVVQLLKQVYGRKSEKMDPDQLRLALLELGAQPSGSGADPAPPAPSQPPDPTTQGGSEPPAPEGKSDKPKRRPFKRIGRHAIPDSLPIEELPHRWPPESECVCPDCGKRKDRFTEERSHILEFVPGSFRHLVDVRVKVACAACQANVSIAPPADKVVDGGLPGPGLVAKVLINKFEDHLPVERQSKIFQREGVYLAPSTLGEWVRAGTEWLEPLALRIHQIILRCTLLQTDDTGLRVLDKTHAGGVRKGYLRVLIGDGKFIYYGYLSDWTGDKARSLFVGRRGFIQQDGYAGLDDLFAGPLPPVCVEVGCWMHARRKVIEAYEGGELRAIEAVAVIQKLFAVEDKAKDLPADLRLAMRQEQSVPLIKELEAWRDRVRPAAPPKTPLGKAITYLTNQWVHLLHFLNHGDLPIDNGASERAARPIALGRNAWLFAGSEAGARRAAIAYTLIRTCIAFGVEPWAYLKDVLAKLAAGWPQSRLDELLPHTWKQEQEKARPQQSSGDAKA